MRGAPRIADVSQAYNVYIYATLPAVALSTLFKSILTEIHFSQLETRASRGIYNIHIYTGGNISCARIKEQGKIQKVRPAAATAYGKYILINHLVVASRVCVYTQNFI